jgi:hypothetical protein
MKQLFDNQIADAQATPVEPLSPANFPIGAYEEYEAARHERCRAFWASDLGVLVYRRMRVAPVFSAGCRDMEMSLKWQLGGLAASMSYEADIPNFLEPWYGIGTIASAFGATYQWEPGQAPATRPLFYSVEEALTAPFCAVAETEIGKHTLEMIRYFVEQTGGRLPLSLTDMQSPLNSATGIVDINSFFLDLMDNPDGVTTFLQRVSDLLIDYTQSQVAEIKKSLVWPGHGFASSRAFSGLGMSDDTVLMLGEEMYRNLVAPAFVRTGEPFGGVAFHSCGDWSAKAGMVRALRHVRMVDGAFSAQTDPSPNPAEVFPEAFVNSGIVLNARIVGGVEVIEETVKKLWCPGMKLIVVTYCTTPEEQAEAYRRIHQICGC